MSNFSVTSANSNPIDPYGLFSESWPTSVVSMEVDLAAYTDAAGTLSQTDIFAFIPSDTEVDRMFIYPIGAHSGEKTASLNVQLVQGLKDGAVQEITDIYTFDGTEHAADEAIELLAVDVLTAGRPVFLRMAGRSVTPVPTWLTSVSLLVSVHFLATFNIDVNRVAVAPADQQQFGGNRQY